MRFQQWKHLVVYQTLIWVSLSAVKSITRRRLGPALPSVAPPKMAVWQSDGCVCLLIDSWSSSWLLRQTEVFKVWQASSCTGPLGCNYRRPVATATTLGALGEHVVGACVSWPERSSPGLRQVGRMTHNKGISTFFFMHHGSIIDGAEMWGGILQELQ